MKPMVSWLRALGVFLPAVMLCGVIFAEGDFLLLCLMALLPPLHQAASDGDITTVKRLIDGGADVNAQTVNGWTPLHYTIEMGEGDAAAIALVKMGADVNVQTKDGDTPLHLAAGHGLTDVITALVEAGANVNAKNEEGEFPLHCAVGVGSSGTDQDQIETTAILIKAGANLYDRNNDGKTPLQMAIDEHGDKSEMATLLRVAIEKQEAKNRQKAEGLLREE